MISASLLTVLAFLQTAPAETTVVRRKGPSLAALANEFGGGIGGTVCCGGLPYAGLMVLAMAMEDDRASNAVASPAVLAATGIIVPFTCALGVSTVGLRYRQGGSFIGAVGGGFLGAWAGYAAGYGISQAADGGELLFVPAGTVLLSSAGAVLGYNLLKVARPARDRRTGQERFEPPQLAFTARGAHAGWQLRLGYRF